MELAFRVRSYEYLKELLFYLSDKGYYWSDGDELYNMEFAEWLWNFFSQTEQLFIILEDDGVYYDSMIHEGYYRNILCYDTIEELDNATYIIPNQASTVRKKIKREYVINVPDILRLDGYPESPVLTRNGDTYLLESGAIYGDAHLFTKTEAEQALKELNVNWKIVKVK